MLSQPVSIFKSLADETRLRTLLLIQSQGELCVCEIACALDLSQPKVSRHLARLRNAELLLDRRQGQWIYYRLSPQLNGWTTMLLQGLSETLKEALIQDSLRLRQMGDRPERQSLCC